MLLLIASSMSSSVGFGLLSSTAFAARIWPDWQSPHCGAPASIHACCSGCGFSSSPRPSIVVTSLPATAESGVTQARPGLPSMSTVQAPHSVMPQPYFVPFIFRSSRSTQSRVASSLTGTVCSCPLMVIFVSATDFLCDTHAIHAPHPKGGDILDNMSGFYRSASYREYLLLCRGFPECFGNFVRYCSTLSRWRPAERRI